jgi:hypothetical protein
METMDSLFQEGPRREALRHMFRADPDAAHDALDGYLETHPRDPLAHSLNAAVTFYHHISNRMPEGPRETLAMVLLGKGIAFPATLKKELELDLGRARTYAKGQCPADLLALAIVEGIKRDYLAMVCQKWMASFECARLASGHARHLLKIDPQAQDACFVRAMTEYMVHRIPGFLRPFTPIEGIRGDLHRAIRHCQAVLHAGHYFQEFARRLLVDLYLDDGNRAHALHEMRILAAEYPGNRGIVQDLRKLIAGG